MDYLDIRFALARKGFTWARIARDLGLSGGQTISQVAMRKYPSARVERRIAEILGKPVEHVFPDRYHKGRKRRAA